MWGIMHSFFRSLKTLLGISALLVASQAWATSPPADPYEGMLFGNWGGLRSRMADAGIEVNAEYKANLWNVADGGLKTGSNYNDNFDLQFTLDGEKLWGIKGNTVYISFLNNFGSRVNASRIGSVEGVDNLETGVSTFKLYEAYVEQQFYGDTLSVLLGVHDLNSEFLVAPYAGNFNKPTLQVTQSIAQSGMNGPDIFPTPGLAARVLYRPTEASYAMVAAFEGIPGDPDHPHGTHIDLTDDEGALLISEIGITPGGASEDNPNKFGVGVWSYTKQQQDVLNTAEKNHQMGAYFLSSYRFYNDEKAGRSVGGSFVAGVADGDTAQVNWDYEVSLVGMGWVPGRAQGEIGLAVTQAHNGSKYRASVAGPTDGSEHGFELYYRDVVYPGVALQPDVQYIVNPGSDPAVSNATLLGLRLDLTL